MGKPESTPLMRLEQHFPKRCTFFFCTRNRRALLAENLERFRSLKKADDELIVIDGGSKDGSAELIAQHLGDLVDAYVSEPDRSEGEALNKAILLARGRYLKVLSDDDIFHEPAIEASLKVMQDHPDIDVLVCGSTVQRHNSDEVVAKWVPPGVNYGKSPSDVFDYYGNGLGLVIRHASVPRVGLFNPHAFSLDWDFITQAIANKTCVRFCRLNVCNHVVFDHSCGIAQTERMEKDQARIARRYGRWDIAFTKDPQNPVEQALGLYYRYRKNFLGRLIRKVTGAPAPQPTRPEPVWDGGFS